MWGIGRAHTRCSISYQVSLRIDSEVTGKILLERVAERARDLLCQICQAREAVIVRGAVSPDHTHMLASCPPGMAPAKLVQYLKGGPRAGSEAEQ